MTVIAKRTVQLTHGRIELSKTSYGGIQCERFSESGSWIAKGNGLTLRDAISGCFFLKNGRDWTTYNGNDRQTVEEIIAYIELTKGKRNGA